MRKKKKKYLPIWDKAYKQKYKNDKRLISLSWIEEGDDDFAINNGYFKVIEGTSGKQFNPGKLSEFEETFYWGYIYPLEIIKMKSYYEFIPKDFNKLNAIFPSYIKGKSSRG